MTILRKALPLTFIATVGLTGCTMTSGGGGSSTSTSSSQSTSESPSSATSSESSQSSTSSESSSDSSSESSTSDETSPSSSDSSSSSSSSSDSSTATKNLTASQLGRFAASNSVRACTISELSHNGSASFCGTDHDSLTAMYKSQYLYFTTATEFQKSATYSYTVSNGSDSATKTVPSSSVDEGAPATIQVYLPMSSSGTYKIVVKRNGTQIATKTVDVTVN